MRFSLTPIRLAFMIPLLANSILGSGELGCHCQFKLGDAATDTTVAYNEQYNTNYCCPGGPPGGVMSECPLDMTSDLDGMKNTNFDYCCSEDVAQAYVQSDGTLVLPWTSTCTLRPGVAATGNAAIGCNEETCPQPTPTPTTYIPVIGSLP